MDGKKLKEFVKLQTKKRELEAEAETVKDKLDTLQAALLKDFEKDGIQNIKVGGFTVYLDRKVWGGAVVSQEDMIKALKRARLGYLVKETCNHNSLAAYVRQLEAAKKKMPKSMVGHLKATETFKVLARKS